MQHLPRFKLQYTSTSIYLSLVPRLSPQEYADPHQAAQTQGAGPIHERCTVDRNCPTGERDAHINDSKVSRCEVLLIYLFTLSHFTAVHP